jgi:hypothetical protein
MGDGCWVLGAPPSLKLRRTSGLLIIAYLLLFIYYLAFYISMSLRVKFKVRSTFEFSIEKSLPNYDYTIQQINDLTNQLFFTINRSLFTIGLVV